MSPPCRESLPEMTLYHFANCLGLAYTPYYLTYKYSGLAEYGAFWKVASRYSSPS